jgi:hypothetical protein
MVNHDAHMSIPQIGIGDTDRRHVRADKLARSAACEGEDSLGPFVLAKSVQFFTKPDVVFLELRTATREVTFPVGQ